MRCLYAHVGFGTPHLAVAAADGSSATTPTILTQALDRNISAPFFVCGKVGADDDSSLIFFSVEDSGRVELASIRLDGSDLTRVLQGEYVLPSIALVAQSLIHLRPIVLQIQRQLSALAWAEGDRRRGDQLSSRTRRAIRHRQRCTVRPAEGAAGDAKADQLQRRVAIQSTAGHRTESRISMQGHARIHSRWTSGDTVSAQPHAPTDILSVVISTAPPVLRLAHTYLHIQARHCKRHCTDVCTLSAWF